MVWKCWLTNIHYWSWCTSQISSHLDSRVFVMPEGTQLLFAGRGLPTTSLATTRCTVQHRSEKKTIPTATLDYFWGRAPFLLVPERTHLSTFKLRIKLVRVGVVTLSLNKWRRGHGVRGSRNVPLSNIFEKWESGVVVLPLVQFSSLPAI